MKSKMKLSIRAGNKPGLEKEFDTDILTIGRDPENLMVIEDIEVSRKHAVIKRMNDGFYVEDLNSTNGTFINGRKVRKTEKIENGDLITLGESVVLVFSSSADELLKNDMIEDSLDLDYPAIRTLPEEAQKAIGKDFAQSNVENSQKKQNVLERFPSWVVILIIALAFLVIFCFVPFVVIELTNQWCNLFSGFFNVLSPGVCP